MADNITRKARSIRPSPELKKELASFNITKDDLKEVSVEAKSDNKLISSPNFPSIMFFLAILVDIIDFVELTVVGIAFSLTVQIIFFVISIFWFYGKMSGRIWKRVLIRAILKRIVVWVIIIIAGELIPIVSIFIPGNMILILMAHNADNKAVIGINKLLNLIHNREIQEVKSMVSRG